MPVFAYPSAGLNISIADFSAWLMALEQGRLISERSLEELWKPALLADGAMSPYGVGWVLSPRANRRTAGGTGGLRSAFAVFPNEDLSIIVLTNLQAAGPESLIDAVAKMYLTP